MTCRYTDLPHLPRFIWYSNFLHGILHWLRTTFEGTCHTFPRRLFLPWWYTFIWSLWHLCRWWLMKHFLMFRGSFETWFSCRGFFMITSSYSCRKFSWLSSSVDCLHEEIWMLWLLGVFDQTLLLRFFIHLKSEGYRIAHCWKRRCWSKFGGQRLLVKISYGSICWSCI